jgi:hypothetical protein
MTKGEIIIEIATILIKYRGSKYAAEYMADSFANYVGIPGGQCPTKNDFWMELMLLREKYKC